MSTNINIQELNFINKDTIQNLASDIHLSSEQQKELIKQLNSSAKTEIYRFMDHRNFENLNNQLNIWSLVGHILWLNSKYQNSAITKLSLQIIMFLVFRDAITQNILTSTEIEQLYKNQEFINTKFYVKQPLINEHFRCYGASPILDNTKSEGIFQRDELNKLNPIIEKYINNKIELSDLIKAYMSNENFIKSYPIDSKWTISAIKKSKK
jgi:hypothetical protein